MNSVFVTKVEEEGWNYFVLGSTGMSGGSDEGRVEIRRRNESAGKGERET